MLAGMTSLATFAHTNPAPTPLTGSAIAFYATGATIVPVLFLAVTLQGRQWQAMLREAASAGRSARENGNLAILIGAHVPIAFAYLVLFAGLFGVGMSIGALAGNSDDPCGTTSCSRQLLILNFAVAGVPLTQWSGTLRVIWSSARLESDDDQASEAQAPDGAGDAELKRAERAQRRKTSRNLRGT